MGSAAQPSLNTGIIVRIWGMDASGHAFFQNVHAQNLTPDSAHLFGLEHQLKVGDTIGIQLADQKARCRVVWVVDAGAIQRTKAGVELLEAQPCPWKKNLEVAAQNPAAPSQSPARNKRRFARHKITFPIELRDPRNNAAMQTNATDISGCGCYVETLIPMPLGTEVKIALWIESEKVNTTGTVKASDPGVGMGIEFTGMNLDTQMRLQQVLEKLDPSGGNRGFDSSTNPSRTAY